MNNREATLSVFSVLSKSYLGVSGLDGCDAPNRFRPTLCRILFSPVIKDEGCIAKLPPDNSIEPDLFEAKVGAISTFMFSGVTCWDGSKFSDATELILRRWLSDGVDVSIGTVVDPTVMFSLCVIEDVIFGQDDDLK